MLAGDRHWLQHQFLGFYTESTRRSMVAKFGRFQLFCEAHDLIALPVRPVTIYRYLRFLREEGRVGVRSLPQYLAAISMVHHSMGHLQFSAFDAVTRRLTQAWRRHEPEPVHSHAPVPSQLMLQVLDFGLTTEDPLLLRAALSAFVDFIFFNRA